MHPWFRRLQLECSMAYPYMDPDGLLMRRVRIHLPSP